MSRGQGWVEGRVDVLLVALGDLGMSASRAAASGLIEQRVQCVSSQMGISALAARRYLTDDAIVDLARSMAFSVAEETPGADVLEAARTAAVPLAIVGRGVAGLAEAVVIRLGERDDVEHLRATIGQLAQALSAVGQVIAEEAAGQAGGEAMVMLPPGLVNRVARYLEVAAALVNDGVLPDGFSPAHAGQLSASFADDAASLRRYAAEPPRS